MLSRLKRSKISQIRKSNNGITVHRELNAITVISIADATLHKY